MKEEANIFTAIDNQDIPEIRELIKNEADIFKKNPYTQLTPVEHAYQHGYHNIVAELTNKISFKKPLQDALAHAARSLQLKTVEAILHSGASPNSSNNVSENLIQRMVNQLKYSEKTEQLYDLFFRNGACPSYVSHKGISLLDETVLIFKKEPRWLPFILKKIANHPLSQDYYTRALNLAIENKYEKAIRLLLRYGAIPNDESIQLATDHYMWLVVPSLCYLKQKNAENKTFNESLLLASMYLFHQPSSPFFKLPLEILMQVFSYIGKNITETDYQGSVQKLNDLALVASTKSINKFCMENKSLPLTQKLTPEKATESLQEVKTFWKEKRPSFFSFSLWVNRLSTEHALARNHLDEKNIDKTLRRFI